VGPNRPLEQGLAALQVSRLDARLAWGNEGGVNVRTDRPCGRRVDPQPEAVSIAGDLARRYGADVIVLHVREHEVSWEGDIDVETAAEPRHLVDVIVRNVKDEGTSAGARWSALRSARRPARSWTRSGMRAPASL
jgi:hypothetical protein